MLPRIEGSGKDARLIVDGKPFFARAGEIHNSSSSNLEYMENRVWPALRGMHLNCVVAPIFWECVEPEEGKFDFTLIDGLIAQARREGVRLVLLWFGLWKNSGSDYVPSWVKLDNKRFFTVKAPSGDLPLFINNLSNRIISPFCEDAVASDAMAFSKVMAHLREVDEKHTVIAIQVENEIGIIGCARDYSPAAEEAYQKEVPDELKKSLGISGSWEEAFGNDAPETFMAWHYGRAVQKIMEAGKKELDLPMYVNAWLEQPPYTPGSYPSGGPQFKMQKIWKLAAPDAAFIAPDIYVDNYRDVCREYNSFGNPLFIPEVRNSADAVAFYLYAVGGHNVLCFSPFGVEDMAGGSGATDADVLAALNISESALASGDRAGSLLGEAYALVESMEDLLEEGRKSGRLHGFLDDGNRSEIIHLENADLQINFGLNPMQGKAPGSPAAGGLVLELSPYEFVVLATGCTLSISPHEGRAGCINLLTKEEGKFVNGEWVRGRILNGDERYVHRFGKHAELQRFVFWEE